MKIALIGYGKMGKMVEKAALDRGHSIIARMTFLQWDMEALKKADICIDFSHPNSVLENIHRIADLKKNMIVGTTGWDDKLEEVEEIVKKNQIGVLYSPNFSVGMHLFLQIIAHASKMMNAFDEYDIAGIEYHHNQKEDSPSGTAIKLTETIKEHLERAYRFNFSSVRCGSIPGTHTILFDSRCDTITMTHEARNREGFALGAVLAAEWLHGRKGLYTFAECLQEIMHKRST